MFHDVQFSSRLLFREQEMCYDVPESKHEVEMLETNAVRLNGKMEK